MIKRVLWIVAVSLFAASVTWAAVTAKFTLNMSLQQTKTLDLNTVRDTVSLNRGPSLTDGTGDNQADVMWHDKRTLADGATETLDIQDGTLTNAVGTAVTIDILKVLYIKNKSSDANLEIGGAPTTDIRLFKVTGDILTLPPGGEFLFSAPLASGVDTTTNSDLKMTHDGTGTSSLDYEIIVVGVD